MKLDWQFTHPNKTITICFLYQRQTEGQKKGTSGQARDQVFSSYGDAIYGDIEGTSAIENGEVCKMLKNLLTSQFADLSK